MTREFLCSMSMTLICVSISSWFQPLKRTSKFVFELALEEFGKKKTEKFLHMRFYAFLCFIIIDWLEFHFRRQPAIWRSPRIVKKKPQQNRLTARWLVVYSRKNKVEKDILMINFGSFIWSSLVLPGPSCPVHICTDKREKEMSCKLGTKKKSSFSSIHHQ